MNKTSHDNSVPCRLVLINTRSLPIITVDAPRRLRAFTICPEFEIPPSAIIATS
jgi:hypothetical protein